MLRFPALGLLIAALLTLQCQSLEESHLVLQNKEDIESLRAEVEALKNLILRSKLDQDDCPCDLTGLENSITENAEDITRNTVTIESMKSDVDVAVEASTANTALVNENKDAINQNKEAIGSNKEAIDNNKATIEELKQEVNDLVTNEIAAIKELMPPVGTILGWVSTMDKSAGPVVDLTSAWGRCDGHDIQDEESPFNNKKAPGMNDESGKGRFLRGANYDWILETSDDKIVQHGHSHNDIGHSHKIKAPETGGECCEVLYEHVELDVTKVYGPEAGTETVPKYLTAEYIVRVK